MKVLTVSDFSVLPHATDKILNNRKIFENVDDTLEVKP
jgi:hypothetical protein